MWSVLAHLPRPVEDLTMLRGLLADDGVLLVLTINANSLLLKRQLDAWGAFTPGHLKFYAPATLRRLLELAGFETVVFRTMYSDDIEAGTSPPAAARAAAAEAGGGARQPRRDVARGGVRARPALGL